MADISVTDKLIENISNSLKKTGVFEKISKIQFYTGTFLLFSSIIGISCVYMNYFNIYYTNCIEGQIDSKVSELENMIGLSCKCNKIEHNKTKDEIVNLDKKITKLLENQHKIILKLEELNVIKSVDEINKPLSTCSSNSAFTPVKKNEMSPNNYETKCDDKDDEYDELLNECYDIMPLNNVKKNTGLSWLFNPIKN